MRDRQTDRKTQTDRQTDRQADRYTYRYIDIYKLNHSKKMLKHLTFLAK